MSVYICRLVDEYVSTLNYELSVDEMRVIIDEFISEIEVPW